MTLTETRSGSKTHALAPDQSYPEYVPNIQIKNVPEDVHAVLTARAAKAGQSLQAYLWNRLVNEARQPTVAEVMDRARTRSGSKVTSEDIVEIIRSHREGR